MRGRISGDKRPCENPGFRLIPNGILTRSDPGYQGDVGLGRPDNSQDYFLDHQRHLPEVKRSIQRIYGPPGAFSNYGGK